MDEDVHPMNDIAMIFVEIFLHILPMSNFISSFRKLMMISICFSMDGLTGLSGENYPRPKPILYEEQPSPVVHHEKIAGWYG